VIFCLFMLYYVSLNLFSYCGGQVRAYVDGLFKCACANAIGVRHTPADVGRYGLALSCLRFYPSYVRLLQGSGEC